MSGGGGAPASLPSLLSHTGSEKSPTGGRQEGKEAEEWS